MRILVAVGLMIFFGGAMPVSAIDKESTPMISSELVKYIEVRSGEFDQIPDERQERLKKLAAYVDGFRKAEEPARLVFICTHNSRRSQMAQIWAATAARHFKITGIETFSGGTESTAFNPRAVAALQRAGLKIDKLDETKNSRYAVHLQDSKEPLICFSKIYRDPPNPKADFCAVMTCSETDSNCPLVSGCTLRVALPFNDPKVADDTDEETAKYDERCLQIGREMLYLFSQVER